MTATIDSLHRYRDELVPAMTAALDRLDPSSREIAYYHLGWADLDGLPQPNGGGKAVRPTLAILSARAAGAPAQVGIPGAVAVELVHNFSLLHDDLMDGDTERRHRPTVWTRWGADSAILVGDAMQALAFEVLLEVGTADAARAAHLLSVATRELIRGQVEDVDFPQRAEVSVAECLEMSAGKTGALLSASASIGAALAGGESGLVDALGTYGAELGVAFQLVDDLLGIWGDPARTGKPVFSDLVSRKKSLPVCHALAQDCAAGLELRAWMSTSDGDDADTDLSRIAQLVADAGGRDWARAEAQRRICTAQHALEFAAIPADVRTELLELAHFIVTREL